MGRFIAFLYGIAVHAVFFVTVLYAFGFAQGLAAHTTIGNGTIAPATEQLFVGLLLVSHFAVQHSVMARTPFKQRWAQFAPLLSRPPLREEARPGAFVSHLSIAVP
jgi:hypothetical protein